MKRVHNHRKIFHNTLWISWISYCSRNSQGDDIAKYEISVSDRNSIMKLTVPHHAASYVPPSAEGGSAFIRRIRSGCFGIRLRRYYLWKKIIFSISTVFKTGYRRPELDVLLLKRERENLIEAARNGRDSGRDRRFQRTCRVPSGSLPSVVIFITNVSGLLEFTWRIGLVCTWHDFSTSLNLELCNDSSGDFVLIKTLFRKEIGSIYIFFSFRVCSCIVCLI